jgi:hypothetical protein
LNQGEFDRNWLGGLIDVGGVCGSAQIDLPDPVSPFRPVGREATRDPTI